MPIFKTYELRDFQKLASQLSENKSNPIIRYLLITDNKLITKTNLEVTVQMKLHPQLPQSSMFDETQKHDFDSNFLVDEKKLFSIVGKTKSETVEIFIEENEVVITDKKFTDSHSIANVDEFPKIIDSEPVYSTQLSQEVINALKVAKSFTVNDGSLNSVVYCFDNLVCAYGGHPEVKFAFYAKELNESVPEMVLTPQFINLISGFDRIKFHDTENKYFFLSEDKGILFVFTKSQYNVIRQFKLHLETIKKLVNGHPFKISKDDIIQFCEHIKATSNSEINICSISNNGLELFRGKNGKSHSKVFIDGNVEPFYFNANIFSNPIKSLPQNVLSCFVNDKKLVVTELDNSFVCFLGINPEL